MVSKNVDKGKAKEDVSGNWNISCGNIKDIRYDAS